MKIVKFLILIEAAVQALAVHSEGSPGFFLKIAKNIPRLGRSPALTNFEKYIMKVSKNIPRIGRRNQPVDPNQTDEEAKNWIDQTMPPSKRMSDNFNLDNLNDYHLIQPLDADTIYDVLTRDVLNSHRFRFVAWKDFDQALEQDGDLYEKLLSIGREANLNISGGSKKFVPLIGDVSFNDLIHYRADRDVTGRGGNDKAEI